LQQGKYRYVKSAIMDLTPTGQKADVHFANAVIKTRRRFTYEEVSAIIAAEEGREPEMAPPEIDDDVRAMLLQMRDLSKILHKRRLKRGSLELQMPEIALEFDDNGKVCGAHFRKHDISHQIVEECMLAANEAVASHLDDKDIYFLRRIHPAPEPTKLAKFAEFARILGYKMKTASDRFSLQRILQQSAGKPEMHAVHYALLRSLKQATYGPIKEDHYALASENYCHFTSPIRRYPDLTVHRLLDHLVKRGKASSNREELIALGEHCSKTERRAESAERELVKQKLLVYMNERVGTDLEAVITGVADYGFFAQAATLPVEGMVHISTLPDDYYYFDEASHTLLGQRTKRAFRLGDKVEVTVVRVDLQRRQLDFRVKGTMGSLPPVRRRR
jgi:ribonuclease R